MSIILGASGEIGSFLANEKAIQTSRIFDKSEVYEWIIGGESFIRQELEKCALADSTSIDIFYCVGDTNPAGSEESLDTLNFQLPKSILKATTDLPFRLITFGSVHENSQISNPYMNSKRKFRDFLFEQATSCNWNHFQLHTLYSENLPKPYMFLGQMLEAIKSDCKFRMSSGSQLRQFHHTFDVVQAVVSSLPKIEKNSVTNVTGTASIHLVDLATRVFSQIGALENLEVGVLEDLVNEIYISLYSVPEFLLLHDFRDSLVEIPKLVTDVWLSR